MGAGHLADGIPCARVAWQRARVRETETDSQASPSRHGTLFRDSMISATILFQAGSLEHLTAAFSSGACLDNRE
jgi:hypothetical protein